ncbi:alkaline phosphatase [Aspergillus clavatus NRRL 1]|uniref:alkaline phosphatase n=1 Tax=Aspergillus clavatus (strain ATCC 1007 / CBS 513.65 / DSM 816 / NCTC 3887 / NRRL 1 / QM 1276 / 107) TaxID=344612 RepID=A1CL92_ASPCL|nr:extracellular phytase, putative [Aspergillus clavatus NRRL 1]EAW09916.1 extracellular phytase, putative [Aspergillus clavatus NRRL 1]
MRFLWISGVSVLVSCAHAQTFQRLGGCPTLGCVFPPDQADFLPGQYFDIRLEVHSPVNGSEARVGEPDPNFKFTITKKGEKGVKPVPATEYFGLQEPQLERWNFTWYEDLFAEDAKKPSLVNVTSKAYRRVALHEPGEYEATLTYYGNQTTKANWLVRDLSKKRRAKNVILFVGDGMTTNMITAARLIAHQSINGKYMSKMQLDKFPVLGHQMTHSMDSFITDSANSATALYSGHKTTVNALNVYVDSSKDPFDDPKFETIVEIFRRRYPGVGVGIVSTAFLADATPAGLAAHTSKRGEYEHVIDAYYEGLTKYEWTNLDGPDVIFGAGAENFLKSKDASRDYYKLFADKGYSISWNNTALHAAPNNTKALGVFQTSNLATWLDRNVYQSNLLNQTNYPDGSGRDAEDLPGLKDMTLKAIDVLNARHGKQGWFLMSEAASIDKQMHNMDYDRALGELLELDDTVRATMEKLKALGQLEDTLILVTADHGHGFDVTGAVDTEYLTTHAHDSDRQKRRAVGTYERSGLSQYTVAGSNSLRYSEGVHFPARWDPRYTLHSGLAAYPDHRENYQVHKGGPRKPASGSGGDYFANYKDAVTGFLVNGTLPVDASQGVHSLTDVPVFAQGPCQELFGGVYNSIDIFFHMAECLGLSETKKP